MAPTGAVHADDAHGVKLLQKRRRLEVLDVEKPPVQPLSKTSAGQATSVSAPDSTGRQSGVASPSRHSWINLQFSPFLQDPGLAL